MRDKETMISHTSF